MTRAKNRVRASPSLPARAQPHPLAMAQSLVAAGQLTAALELAQRYVTADPQSAAGHNLLAIVAVMEKRAPAAVHHANQAARLAPSDARVQFTLGRACKLAGELPAAVAAYRRAIELEPGYAEAHVSLGIALKQAGDLDAAVACHRRAIELNPQLGVAHGNLGIALAAQAEQAAKASSDGPPTDDLLLSIERSLQLDPHNALLHRNRGVLLMRGGRYREAADALNQALGLDPRDVECCLRLGGCLKALGDTGKAIELHERWLALNPPAAPVMRALADLLTPAGRVDEALRWAEQALALDPDAAALLQMAAACQQCRRIEEAVRLGRQAAELSAGQPDYHPLVLLSSNYLYEEPEPIFELHARYGAVLAEHARQTAPAAVARRAFPVLAPGQRLKVGYVSGDFVTHSVSYFASALLEQHDPSRFEVVCYHNRHWGDAVTERLQGLGHAWVECATLNDLQLSRRIQADGVHILVDLAGHTSDSRLNVFALRAAPVQIGYLGYPTISGVQTMDFRISDTVIDAGDMPALAAEQPLCLPRSMFCYRPPEAPDVGPLPRLRTGVVTFGSFNNVAKLSDRTLRLWAQVLHAVPGSHLLLKSTSMAAAATRDNIMAFMAQQGIAPERLRLVARVSSTQGHLGLYNEVDVALDSFPFNGATTTCEALWMGVPVVSRRGRTHTSRMGASILGAAGHADWVADDDAAYVATAARLAADAEGLARWRAEARASLAASPLLDGPSFTRSFEAALERAWALVAARERQALAAEATAPVAA